MEYRYKATKNNITESWTGSFFYKKLAQKWRRKHGKFWKNRGYKLRLYIYKEPDLSEIINDILE